MKSYGPTLIIESKKGNISCLLSDNTLSYDENGLKINIPAEVILRMESVIKAEVERLGENYEEWGRKLFENLNTKDN